MTIWEDVQTRIAKSAEKSGRKSGDITVVAVTKTVPYERVEPLLKAGVRQIGENRVQEALEKWQVARDKWHVKPTFHLIGPLQSNKAKKAVQFFDVIQTLDRFDLAQDLNRHAQEAGKVQDCLVQVKISDEATKSGLDPAQLSDFLLSLRPLSNLRICGLMGIPPYAAQGDQSRPYFQKLRRLRDDAHLDTLSMGMSSDFEAAIEEGSTMVRLGTVLFGARNYA
jgi:PLP dependent protein